VEYPSLAPVRKKLEGIEKNYPKSAMRRSMLESKVQLHEGCVELCLLRIAVTKDISFTRTSGRRSSRGWLKAIHIVS
jgi:hypothetical protein